MVTREGRKKLARFRLVHRSGKKPQKIPQTPDGKSIGAKVAAVLNFDEAREISENLGADSGLASFRGKEARWFPRDSKELQRFSKYNKPFMTVGPI